MDKKSSYTGFTEARKKANEKYIQKHNLVETKFRTTKEEKETLQTHAIKMNESVNSFIKRAILEAIERDNKNIAVK